MPIHGTEVMKKKKLIVIPTLLVMIAILAAGLSSYWISRSLLLQQLEREGYNYAELLIWQIDSQREPANPDGQAVVTRGVNEERFADVLHGPTERLQYLVETFAQKEHVEYALILDKNLTAIADSDWEEVGWRYEDDEEYRLALQGQFSSVIWHYPYLSEKVLEVALPIQHNGTIEGVVGIGLNMKPVNESIVLIGGASLLIALCLLGSFYAVQQKNVYAPLRKLEHEIAQLSYDCEKPQNLTFSHHDPFEGLYHRVNILLGKIHESISHIHYMNKEMEIQSIHDQLTGLPNRRALTKIGDALKKKDSVCAVMMLDLDDFKSINDTYGHIYGDRILREVAKRLKVLEGQGQHVYRFGGDEFIILLSPVEGTEKVQCVVEKIIQLIEMPIQMEDHEHHLTCSLGVSTGNGSVEGMGDLVRLADLAMFEAKKSGVRSYCFYDAAMSQKIAERNQVEWLLRQAGREGGFKLLYQPQIDAHSGEVVAFEALLRLKDQDVYPDVFIPFAERSGQIIPMGRWVVKEVVQQLRKWMDQGRPLKPVSINFSVVQLEDQTYAEFLRSELEAHKVSPALIHIEITENIMIDQQEIAVQFLTNLKELGVSLVLDDFGKGYSSLNYLAYLPVDAIKLDKSLSDQYHEVKSANIIANIMLLAHSLQLKTIAEGIETADQFRYFQLLGCNQLQGYLFSKPLEIKDLEQAYNKNYLEMTTADQGHRFHCGA